ncbi:BON domain-containing protein [Massilia sp. DWR3-1-1]|uniref:BON domain-containing protein n=1 Tax=Massilia sp. DWR3-1-1 TaxID=2804559 RepID=UPI003CED6092
MSTDKEVKQNVEHELAWDPVIDAGGVTVGVKDGVVTLTGVVHRYGEKLQAERAAKRVKGVYGLANDIEVRIGPDARSDAEIAHDAVHALQIQLPVSSKNIKTIVENAHVRLEGQVQWNYQRQRAETAVRSLHGVKGVQNEITLLPGVAPKEIRGAIQAAFHRNAQLEANRITIEVSGADVVLTGTVKTWAEREEAERAAWMAPGVNTVRNSIVLGS